MGQVVGLAYFLYIGLPASKENDDRVEAKVDALLRMDAGEAAEQLIADLDEHYLRKDGHAKPHGHEANWRNGGPRTWSKVGRNEGPIEINSNCLPWTVERLPLRRRNSLTSECHTESAFII